MPNAEKKHKEARCRQHFVTLCRLKHNKHLYNRLGSMSQLRVFGVTNRINKMKNKTYHTTGTVPKSNRTTVEREATSNRTTVEREAKSNTTTVEREAKSNRTTVEREAKSNRTTVEREAKSKHLAKHNT